jgi:hypothetical protein
MQSDRNDFLWNVHGYVNEHIRFADTKAAIVLAWAGAIVGGLVSNGSYKNFQEGRLFQPESWLLAWATLIAFLLLAIAWLVAVLVVTPRVTYSDGGMKGLIFWRQVKMFPDATNYTTAVEQCSNLQACVAEHVYDLSNVADQKFIRVSYSILIALAGTALATLIYILE